MVMRVVGIGLIGLSLIILGVNALVALEQGGFTILSLGETWALLAHQSFTNLFGNDTDPAAISGVIGFFLGFPAFAPFLLLGLIFIFLRPRKRKGIFRPKNR